MGKVGKQCVRQEHYRIPLRRKGRELQTLSQGCGHSSRDEVLLQKPLCARASLEPSAGAALGMTGRAVETPTQEIPGTEGREGSRCPGAEGKEGKEEQEEEAGARWLRPERPLLPRVSKGGTPTSFPREDGSIKIPPFSARRDSVSFMCWLNTRARSPLGEGTFLPSPVSLCHCTDSPERNNSLRLGSQCRNSSNKLQMSEPAQGEYEHAQHLPLALSRTFSLLGSSTEQGAKGSSDPARALWPSAAPAPLLEEAQKHSPPAQNPPSASTWTQLDGRKEPEFPTPALFPQV